MARHHLHLVSVLFVATIVASPPTASAKSLSSSMVAPPMAASPTAHSLTPTAYDILEKYNLTRGILPEGVTGYVLQPDGSFEVHLPGDCSIHATNMQIKYSSRIAGNIQPQSIHDLEGVKVEMMLVWIGITVVTRTDDQLNFFVGPISKSFPIDSFANSLQCN
ncbi:hypothetical protein SETIT_8G082200v2 [Setaria italica]|uniref:Uncharacterized protein n=1 Tax=Setaria italica TaxID=4555 RepID=K3ZN88_SETIT|nr:hypothetical protein SETIT_8G082200v2 [Setaria italica]